MTRERAEEECTTMGEAYTEGYHQGIADEFNAILNEMRKSPFASEQAMYVKKYIVEQLKEQK